MASKLTCNRDELQFLNIEQPLQIKSAENRRLVRRCATLSRNKNKARSPTARPSNSSNANGTNEKVHLHGMIGSGSTDPFRAFPVEMETYMYQLFDYSKKWPLQPCYSPLSFTNQNKLESCRKPYHSDFQAQKVADIQEIVKQSLTYRLFPYKSTAGFHPGQTMLRFSVLDARVLHSTLSITSFAVAKGDKKIHIWGLEHRGHTIQLINKSLRDQVDKSPEAAVLAVVQMGSVEVTRAHVVRGDCNAWKSHMRGLRQIVHMHGGLGIYPSLWYNISEVDFMGSYMFGHAPFFSSDDYQPSYTARSNLDVCSNSAAQPASSLNNVVRSKLSLLPETQVLSEELNSIVAEMHVLNQDFQCDYGQSYSCSHINHMLKSCRAIELHLFSLLHEDPPTSCDIQYAYILGLQIYMNRVFRTFKRGEHLLSRLAARLRHVLLEIEIDENDHWEQVSSLLLWISFVAGASCANGALRMWYVTFAGYIRRRLDLSTWEGVNTILKDRLYSAGHLAESFCEFWNDEEEDFSIGIGAGIVWPGPSRLTINNSIND